MTSTTTNPPSDGSVLTHPDTGGHPALDGAPIARVTGPLRACLVELATHLDPPGAATDPDGAACDALRLLAAAAHDTAEAGEQRGLLFVTPPVAQLGRRPVWLWRGEDGTITAGFPTDYR
ncbi:hypothetical protein ACIPYS_07620 [Kitasatospora sp. NPDC089913]|uniref:hypothetical protein n=1 Tax=Kitasatospora sp. NPDC089913 TaxID=3364080 RepID=UPI0038216D22